MVGCPTAGGVACACTLSAPGAGGVASDPACGGISCETKLWLGGGVTASWNWQFGGAAGVNRNS